LSRPLVILAALVLAAAGLLPIAAMAARVAPADLAGLFDARALELLGRTLGYGLSSTALAVVLGAPFGFLVAKTDLPLAAWLGPLGVVPLLLPPMLIAMVATELTSLEGGAAAVLVSGVGTFPLMGLFTARAFERIDGRLDEAALLAGGTRAAVRASLYPVLPAVLSGACLAFVFTVNDFSIPDYVSWVGAEKFSVYADSIFAAWRIDARPGTAVATALPLVALTLAALLPALALRRRGALATLGAGYRRGRVLPLGPWRWPAFALAAALVALAALLPIARLAFEAGGGTRPGGWSSAAFTAAFQRALELARGDLQNSVLYALAAASLCALLGLVLGHALERAPRGRVFEPLVLLPLAVPAILFGIGVIATWNHAWCAPFYDGGGLVVLLLTGRFAALSVLALGAAVAMLDPSHEDAARVSGARPAARLFRIVAPSLRSSWAGAWVLVFVFALRELDSTILVPAANHTAMFRVFNALHFGRDDFVAALALLTVALILLPSALWVLFGRPRAEPAP